MRPIPLSGGRSLRRLDESDAVALHAVVEANRDFLRPWLPWADAQDLDGTRRFVRTACEQAAANNGFHAAITGPDGRILGVIGFHYVDWNNRATSLGYWLARDATGKGTMTKAAAALIDVAFNEWKLNRVEIRAAPDNMPSRRVAERLGLVQEGLLRDAERHPDGFRDLVLYAMLARDWRCQPSR